MPGRRQYLLGAVGKGIGRDGLLAAAIDHVGDRAAILRPHRQVCSGAAARGHGLRVAAVGRTRRKDPPAPDEPYLLAVGRERQRAETRGERDVRGHGQIRSSAQLDRDLMCRAARGIVGPQALRPLEGNGVPIARDRGEEHAPRTEMRQLARAAAGPLPEFVAAAAIGDVVQRASVGRPHRPAILGLSGGDRFEVLIGEVFDGDLALVHVAVAATPPLAEAVANVDEIGAVGRRYRVHRIDEGLVQHGHRRATLDIDAVDVVLVGEIVHGRREIDEASVARPRIDIRRDVVVRQARNGAVGEIDHVDAARARPARNERKALTVGREQRPVCIAPGGRQQPGRSASAGHAPHVAA